MNGSLAMSPCWSQRTFVLAVVLLILVSPGCTKQDAAKPSGSAPPVSDAEQPTHETAHWSYHGDTGPDHWGDLDPAYVAAKNGREQSPIDIKSDSAKTSELPPIRLTFKGPADLKVFNNGHAVRADVPDGAGSLAIGDETFKLIQFHFHAPSEHLVDGKEFAGEMHLVHESEDGTLAVIGVFIEKGSAHQELAKFWGDLPHPSEDGHGKGKEETVAAFDLNTLLPDDLDSYRYAGSLTTPPCSEGVKWTVLAKPIQLSDEQIQAFVALFSGTDFPDGNRRPCLPLNGRVVQTDVN